MNSEDLYKSCVIDRTQQKLIEGYGIEKDIFKLLEEAELSLLKNKIIKNKNKKSYLKLTEIAFNDDEISKKITTSIKTNVGDNFFDLLNENLKELFNEQVKIILEDEKDNSKDKKRILTSEINDLKEKIDLIEYRFAINEISRDIFERQNQKLKESLNQKMIEIEKLPTKKSNQEKAIKYFTRIAVNPSEFYEKLEYNQKRVFQKLLFPEGLQYSLKNKEYLTSKTGTLFELTNSFSNTYDTKTKKTHQENPDKSHLVPGVGIEQTPTSSLFSGVSNSKI